MKVEDQQKFITVAEIARILGISRIAAFKKVKPGIKNGTITAVQKGIGYYIQENQVGTSFSFLFPKGIWKQKLSKNIQKLQSPKRKEMYTENQTIGSL